MLVVALVATITAAVAGAMVVVTAMAAAAMIVAAAAPVVMAVTVLPATMVGRMLKFCQLQLTR